MYLSFPERMSVAGVAFPLFPPPSKSPKPKHSESKCTITITAGGDSTIVTVRARSRIAPIISINWQGAAVQAGRSSTKAMVDYGKLRTASLRGIFAGVYIVS